ncbi:MAG: ABC transporter ATP-binding protein [Butyrivibrio sp.]
MIEVKAVTKTFDGYRALDNVSCKIPEGCIYGMIGSNGAGKSTFLRLISGVYVPDSGEILIDGEPVYENVKIKNRIAFVPDEFYFMTGSSMKRMAEIYRSVYGNFDMDRFNKLTEMFKLSPNKSLNTFSKGMRRQAAIILALSTRPKYVFFDEAFDGLDPVMRKLVKTILYSDIEENGTTAIITSHSLRELEDICDELALLHMGGLVLESDVTSLETSLFKVQTAFEDDYDRNRFKELNVLEFEKNGSVSNMIIKGDREKTESAIKAMNPLFLDILPLTLEEVFTYEMASLGYTFDPELLGEGDEDEK